MNFKLCVCLFWQPEDKYKQTVVPGSEYEVSRTAYKDNRTFYTVKKDGREQERNAKDVHSLLLKDGIDLEQNRFLILQVSTRTSGFIPCST